MWATSSACQYSSGTKAEKLSKAFTTLKASRSPSKRHSFFSPAPSGPAAPGEASEPLRFLLFRLLSLLRNICKPARCGWKRATWLTTAKVKVEVQLEVKVHNSWGVREQPHYSPPKTSNEAWPPSQPACSCSHNRSAEWHLHLQATHPLILDSGQVTPTSTASSPAHPVRRQRN